MKITRKLSKDLIRINRSLLSGKKRKTTLAQAFLAERKGESEVPLLSMLHIYCSNYGESVALH